jgi:hypothetical protein
VCQDRCPNRSYETAEHESQGMTFPELSIRTTKEESQVKI